MAPKAIRSDCVVTTKKQTHDHVTKRDTRSSCDCHLSSQAHAGWTLHVEPRTAGGAIDRGELGRPHAARSTVTSQGEAQRPSNQACSSPSISPDRPIVSSPISRRPFEGSVTQLTLTRAPAPGRRRTPNRIRRHLRCDERSIARRATTPLGSTRPFQHHLTHVYVCASHSRTDTRAHSSVSLCPLAHAPLSHADDSFALHS